MTLKMLNKAPDNMDLRQYVVEKIKAPLRKAMVTLAKRYPEPTLENLVHPNSFILLALSEKFLEYEDNPSRIDMFRAIWRMFIAEYEHDSYYRHRIDWLVEEIANSDWKPRPLNHPDHCWKEPQPCGGGESIIKGGL